MNVNVEAVHTSLSLRLQSGRTPAEAAGEAYWMTDWEMELGVLSNQTAGEIASVVDEWLESHSGSIFNIAKAEARAYFAFLKERLDKKDPLLLFAIDDALMSWRRTT